jgi:hypothetical protein
MTASSVLQFMPRPCQLRLGFGHFIGQPAQTAAMIRIVKIHFVILALGGEAIAAEQIAAIAAAEQSERLARAAMSGGRGLIGFCVFAQTTSAFFPEGAANRPGRRSCPAQGAAACRAAAPSIN